MAEQLELGLTRGDHFRGLQLEDKLYRYLGRKEWVSHQLRQLNDTDRRNYRDALKRLLMDLAPPPLPAGLTNRILELGLGFMIDEHRHALIPLEYAFLSDAAWTLNGSLAQALVAYLAQGVIPRQAIRTSGSTSRALQGVASIYLHLRQSWKTQIPGLSLRQLLAIETMHLSASSQPASRLASLLGAGSPEVFSWPRYMRYHGSGSHNALQELLYLGLVRPKTLDPGSALKEFMISLEAEKPIAKALPPMFKRYAKSVRRARESSLLQSAPPGNLGLDLQRFIVALGIMPPPATKDGTPSMIHVDRLARLLGIAQQYQRFLLSVAWDVDWLARCAAGETDRIEPSAEAEQLIAKGPMAFQEVAVSCLGILSSWDETRASACRLGNPGPMTHLVGRLRSFLLELSGALKRWTPISGVTSLLIGSPGFRRLLATAPDLAPVTEILNAPHDSSPPLLESLATTLWWAHEIEIARDHAGLLYVRGVTKKTPPEEEAGQAPEESIKVAASGEFYLPIQTPLQRLRKAAEVADILGVDRACRFRVTKQSLLRSRKLGWTLEEVEAFLENSLPQNLHHIAEEVFVEVDIKE